MAQVHMKAKLLCSYHLVLCRLENTNLYLVQCFDHMNHEHIQQFPPSRPQKAVIHPMHCRGRICCSPSEASENIRQTPTTWDPLVFSSPRGKGSNYCYPQQSKWIYEQNFSAAEIQPLYFNTFSTGMGEADVAPGSAVHPWDGDTLGTNIATSPSIYKLCCLFFLVSWQWPRDSEWESC